MNVMDTARNGGDTAPTRGETPDLGCGGFDPSSQKGLREGWVRGHQRDGGGYSKEMPKQITAKPFFKARLEEIQAMQRAVSKTTGSCHVFGQLPKHMRRRAMSHNTKRLPCRLREVANSMREKSNLAASKKKKEESKAKSRKARRRHGNLLQEFNRRQRKNRWLETHIWHAKRFHMVKRWGYCLGERPAYKCYRASYRAMSSHCLLQDLSYYCCIELQGEQDELLAALSKLTSKEAGPTFAAALCLSGQRQGSVVLYRAGQYPSQALGPVTFLWRPRIQDSAHRQLWIWAHPSLKQDLLPELQGVCQCFEAVIPPEVPVVAPADSVRVTAPKQESVRSAKAPGAKRKHSSEEEEDKPPAKKILGDGTRPPNTPVTWKSCSTEIVINDLTLDIVRFRLIGPQSHCVLTKTLEAATACDANKLQSSSLWWPEHCRDEDKMKLHRRQADLFHILGGIHSSGELPSGTVLGLTVDDPRLTLPQKKDKAMPSIQQAQEVDEEKRRELILRGVPEPCCQSSLWDRSVRDNVTDNSMSVKELNHLRSEVLVPGSRLTVPPQGRVPILLVHQPGKQVGQEMNSWGSGWDLLLPKGWGMFFWVPLVYRGVQVGGLHMSLKHSQNKGAPHFPHDYPDCPAGVCFQEEQETELLNKYKRRPPSKRTNYIKHGCVAPFRCPWQQLAVEWDIITREGGATQHDLQVTSIGQTATPESGEVTAHGFTVLRNRKSLRLLSSWCRQTSARGQRLHRVGQVPPLVPQSAESLLSAHRRSLVWARLSLLCKGKPDLHAMVCVPTPEDLTLLRKEPGCSGPQEPVHKDHFKAKVKCRRKGSKKAAAASSSSHMPERKDLDLPSTSAPMLTLSAGQSSDPVSATTDPLLGSSLISSEDPKPSSPSCFSSSELVMGLWPDPLPSVASHCSRVTLGWVTQSDFSLSVGRGEALGLVSLSGLLDTLLSQPAEQRGLVLIRSPSSYKYRFAKINVDV